MTHCRGRARDWHRYFKQELERRNLSFTELSAPANSTLPPPVPLEQMVFDDFDLLKIPDADFQDIVELSRHEPGNSIVQVSLSRDYHYLANYPADPRACKISYTLHLYTLDGVDEKTIMFSWGIRRARLHVVDPVTAWDYFKLTDTSIPLRLALRKTYDARDIILRTLDEYQRLIRT